MVETGQIGGVEITGGDLTPSLSFSIEVTSLVERKVWMRFSWPKVLAPTFDADRVFKGRAPPYWERVSLTAAAFS